MTYPEWPDERRLFGGREHPQPIPLPIQEQFDGAAGVGSVSMWNQGVTFGCMFMWVAWVVAFAFVALAWIVDAHGLGQTGLAVSALAAALTIVRDNHRTRRMIHANEKRRTGGAGGVTQIR